MEIKYNKLLLIDGSHALHRCIEQLNLWEMRNQENQRTGGIYGMLKVLQKELFIDDYFPVVIFDGQLSPRRLSIYDNYKKHKEKMNLKMLYENYNSLEYTMNEFEMLKIEKQQEYNRQREIVIEILTCLGIPVFHLEDWEGDDLIYLFSKMTRDSIVVSDDKDMWQLICNTNDRRCRVRREVANEFWDLKSLQQEGYSSVEEYIACKAICGDDSDNIPQTCYKVGGKTAIGLYKLYMHCKMNNIEFPKDEKSLAELCKKLGLSKRVAYLNFNENQFLTNMLLMDLSFVDDDVTEEFLVFLDREMRNRIRYNDITLSQKLLQAQNINSFEVYSIFNKVNQLQVYAFIDTIDKANELDSNKKLVPNGLF